MLSPSFSIFLRHVSLCAHRSTKRRPDSTRGLLIVDWFYIFLLKDFRRSAWNLILWFSYKRNTKPICNDIRIWNHSFARFNFLHISFYQIDWCNQGQHILLQTKFRRWFDLIFIFLFCSFHFVLIMRLISSGLKMTKYWSSLSFSRASDGRYYLSILCSSSNLMNLHLSSVYFW